MKKDDPKKSALLTSWIARIIPKLSLATIFHQRHLTKKLFLLWLDPNCKPGGLEKPWLALLILFAFIEMY